MISIYLDMDGVLCDFSKRVAEIFPEFSDLKGIYADEIRTPEQEELFTRMTNKILSDTHFWENLEWMPNGKVLHDFLLDNMSDNITVSILTSPLPNDPWCSMGKLKWIANNFHLPVKHFIAHRNKWMYVGHHPNEYQVLVDDRESNIENWFKLSEDGIGILHKDEDIDFTINSLKEIIKKAGI